MKFWILLLLLFLTACVKPEQVKNSLPLEQSVNISNETVQEVAQEGNLTYYSEIEKQRRREAVINIFDFSILTAENCDFYYEYIINQAIQSNQDRADLKNDLYINNAKADELYKNMRASESAGNEADALDYKEAYQKKLDKINDINNEVKALNKKEQDFIYIRQEIKEDCIFLKKEKGLNTIKQ